MRNKSFTSQVRNGNGSHGRAYLDSLDAVKVRKEALLHEANLLLLRTGGVSQAVRKYCEAGEVLQGAIGAAIFKHSNLLAKLRRQNLKSLEMDAKYFDMVSILMLNGERELANAYKAKGIQTYKNVGMPWYIVAMHVVTGDNEAALESATHWVQHLKKKTHYQDAVIIARLVGKDSWAVKIAEEGADFFHTEGSHDLGLVMSLLKEGNYTKMGKFVSNVLTIVNLVKPNFISSTKKVLRTEEKSVTKQNGSSLTLAPA